MNARFSSLETATNDHGKLLLTGDEQADPLATKLRELGVEPESL
jgi:hypothetical protein